MEPSQPSADHRRPSGPAAPPLAGPLDALRLAAPARPHRAAAVVTLGGIVIIGSILAILFVIVGEAYPLLRPARMLERSSRSRPARCWPLAIGATSTARRRYIVTRTGVRFLRSLTGASADRLELAELGAARVTSVSAAGHRHAPARPLGRTRAPRRNRRSRFGQIRRGGALANRARRRSSTIRRAARSALRRARRVRIRGPVSARSASGKGRSRCFKVDGDDRWSERRCASESAGLARAPDAR